MLSLVIVKNNMDSARIGNPHLNDINNNSTIFLCFQSISEFLKDLPCHNEQNFSLFNTENGIRTSSRRPPVYLPTEEIPSEQSEWHSGKSCISTSDSVWANIDYFLLIFLYCSHCHREEKYSVTLFAPAMGEEGEYATTHDALAHDDNYVALMYANFANKYLKYVLFVMSQTPLKKREHANDTNTENGGRSKRPRTERNDTNWFVVRCWSISGIIPDF